MTAISVVSVNVKSNPLVAQSKVVARTRQAMSKGDVVMGQEITPARYKKAWTAESARAGKRPFGTGSETPISLGGNLKATKAYTRKVHGGLAHVSPTRAYTVVQAVTPDGLKVAFVCLHPVSKGYVGARNRASKWPWRNARLKDYQHAVAVETQQLYNAGFTVVVGGDCNDPKPPKPHQYAAVLAGQGLDHMWVLAGPNHSVGNRSHGITGASASLQMDHPIIVGRFTLVAAGKHTAPTPQPVVVPTKPPAPTKEPTVAAPEPTYVGPPKFHGASNNKPIHRYVIHATVGQEPGVKGAARNTVAMTKRTSRPSSYHYISDAAETLQLTYDSVVAYHAPPNSNSLGHELCCSLSHEGKGHWSDDAHQKMLHLAAQNCAQACAAYDIPVVKLSVSDLKAGKRGICGHIDVSNAWHQSSHWDPGPYFPWNDFIALVKHYTANPATDPEEMTVAQMDALNKRLDAQDSMLKWIAAKTIATNNAVGALVKSGGEFDQMQADLDRLTAGLDAAAEAGK